MLRGCPQGSLCPCGKELSPGGPHHDAATHPKWAATSLGGAWSLFLLSQLRASVGLKGDACTARKSKAPAHVCLSLGALCCSRAAWPFEAGQGESVILVMCPSVLMVKTGSAWGVLEPHCSVRGSVRGQWFPEHWPRGLDTQRGPGCLDSPPGRGAQSGGETHLTALRSGTG